MVEYVYALHDFLPEHEDEVTFHTGERIEVVEKDDLYGDGWWKGRNLAGKVGLFPQSYTTTAPPADPPAASVAPSTSTAANDTDSTPLEPLTEESETGSPESPVPQIYLNGDDTDPAADPNGEVMKATMTDVQKAIEQLGNRNRGSSANIDQDARSFSFASTRDDRTTDDEEDETDFDMSEGEGWHKGARRKLAERAREAIARQAIVDAEELERLSSGVSSSRMVAPPIDVELSGESDSEDDEGEDNFATSPLRDHPYIPEEEEPLDPVDQLGRMRIPEEEPATATAPSFPVHAEIPPTPVSPGIPPPPAVPLPPPVHQERVSTPLRETLVPSPGPGLPSPAPSGGAAAIGSKHSSIASSTALVPGGPSKPSSVASAPLSAVSEGRRRDDSGHASGSGGSANGISKHPSEWTVEDVVDWLKSKGFDEDVCDKFTEQEITGDVLLDLDVNLLKTEIGIMAFGKRMRIANAIVDLRRPASPSASFSYNAQSSPQHPQYPVAYSTSQNSQPYPSSPQNSQPHPSSPQVHSRTQSQSHSQQSHTGGHISMSSSVGSPLQNGYLARTYGMASGLMSPESATHTGDLFGNPVDGHEAVMPNMQDGERLGIPLSEQGSGARSKGRPAQLMLSPSDGALNVSATQTNEPEGQEDERAAMSESELPHANASIRRRLFGTRSPVGSPHSATADKDSQASVHSKEKETESPVEVKAADKATSKKKDNASNTVATGPGRHARGKKSIDASNPGKAGDRLSIFGASFGGTLGRKPAPRYSGGPEDEKADKSSSGFTLPRLSRKNGRPTTPGGPPRLPQSPQASPDPAPANGSHPAPANPALLRKRTSSSHATDATKAASAATASTAVNAPAGSAVSKLKPGQSILEQIGEPDHVGWMRKKGDRYNSWKLRYFILKGPDFYCLKTSNKSESKIKGYVNIVGYKVTVDETVNPGRYGFRIDHDHDKTHYFSSDEKTVVRDWMKAIMKATIGRDYSKPVVSSCNIPTIPLMVAQAMNPAPRPPSPTARAATQRALRRENTDQPSTRDARVLMLTGFASNEGPKEERARLDSFFTTEPIDNAPGTGSVPASPQSTVPPRPTRRMSSQQAPTPVDEGLIEWANTHLPSNLQITDPMGALCDGLGLLRLAESIKGRPSSPPVPDSAFPKDSSDDNLDGLFRLFDFLLDNEVRMGSVSIQDIRRGKRDKIIQLLRGLKGWEDKRQAIATSIGKGSAQAGGFMAPAWSGM
ncbi:hypothetical protein B0H17DRAFT_993337 [Mycena rosella]|uniref:Uncharacterized protein n=1 Tax=Mycena rosella TaxID=1033263 RepID=A0AAD7CNF7_MYCRO|nr:hypothetical protein B0H17DRAFT_993337 [Mycena rosella]